VGACQPHLAGYRLQRFSMRKSRTSCPPLSDPWLVRPDACGDGHLSLSNVVRRTPRDTRQESHNVMGVAIEVAGDPGSVSLTLARRTRFRLAETGRRQRCCT